MFFLQDHLLLQKYQNVQQFIPVLSFEIHCQESSYSLCQKLSVQRSSPTKWVVGPQFLSSFPDRMSGAVLVLLCELFNVEHARSHRKFKETPTTSETHDRKRKCEKHHPERKFNCDWQTKRHWLNQFEDIKNSMTCTVCIEHYGTDANRNVS